MSSHPLQGGHGHPYFTDEKTEVGTYSNCEEVNSQQAPGQLRWLCCLWFQCPIPSLRGPVRVCNPSPF